MSFKYETEDLDIVEIDADEFGATFGCVAIKVDEVGPAGWPTYKFVGTNYDVHALLADYFPDETPDFIESNYKPVEN